MIPSNGHSKIEKQVLTKDAIDFLNSDLHEKHEELLDSCSMLKEEKNKLKLAFDEIEDIYNHAPCGYHSLDENGVYVRVNQTELNWLGYTKEELVNKKRFSDLLTSESVITFVKHFPRFRETGEITDLEFNMIRKDGTILPILMNATAVFDEKGNFKLSRSVILNNSERKKMEKELLQMNRSLLDTQKLMEDKNSQLERLNRELQVANDEINLLFNMASKELKQPIMKIMDASEQLLGDASINKYHNDLQTVKESTIKIKHLVRNTLVQHRMATGDREINKVRINLSSLLVNLCNLYEEKAQQRKLKLNCEIFEKLFYITDEDYLAQIVDNMLAHAIKSSPPDKEVCLRLDKKADGIFIEVEDKGPGYKPEEIPALFQKYPIQPNAIKAAEGLSGLELPIAKILADKINSTLTVQSEPGKGTIYALNMPYRDVYQVFA